MPLVIAEMWEERTGDQRAKLIKEITKAFKEIGVEAEHLRLVAVYARRTSIKGFTAQV